MIPMPVKAEAEENRHPSLCNDWLNLQISLDSTIVRHIGNIVNAEVNNIF